MGTQSTHNTSNNRHDNSANQDTAPLHVTGGIRPRDWHLANQRVAFAHVPLTVQLSVIMRVRKVTMYDSSLWRV